MKILAGAEFMKFENLQPEDLMDLYKVDGPLMTQITNMSLEEMISVVSQKISKRELQVEKSLSSFPSIREDKIKSGSFKLEQRVSQLKNGNKDEMLSPSSLVRDNIQKSRTQR